MVPGMAHTTDGKGRRARNMARLQAKVAFITGAARGQGRSHAVRLAEEGADIIALDICNQVDSVFYPMASKEDLEETERLVRATGRRIVSRVADVRNIEEVEDAYKAGTEELGPVDIVLPNAGIMPVIGAGFERKAWHDAIDTMLTGVWNVLDVTIPDLIERGVGGSIIITSSTAGLSSIGLNTFPGQAGYVAAKHGVVGLMRLYAAKLGRYSMRVNTIHPTGVNTPMVVNDEYAAWVSENPRALDGAFQNTLPVRLIEPVDISNAIVFLASDEGRYITGITMPVDAGYLVL
jgi:SDR family mycofactocin-dependent oxidoreductase